MKDNVGKLLLNWRIDTVLPCISGELLDIGCGTNELVRRYGKGIGTDIYQWGKVDVVVEDSAQLPLENESFDTVTIIAALNHIPNREAVLKEAFRLLRKDGIIIVTTIPSGISRVWHFLRRPWDADQKDRGMISGEVFGFSRKQVRMLLEEAGFTVMRQKSFMLGVNCLIQAGKTA